MEVEERMKLTQKVAQFQYYVYIWRMEKHLKHLKKLDIFN